MKSNLLRSLKTGPNAFGCWVIFVISSSHHTLKIFLGSPKTAFTQPKNIILGRASMHMGAPSGGGQLVWPFCHMKHTDPNLHPPRGIRSKCIKQQVFLPTFNLTVFRKCFYHHAFITTFFSRPRPPNSSIVLFINTSRARGVSLPYFFVAPNIVNS